jgi:flap endonuclease-1
MFMENGIKPVWVFDGKPPEMKAQELAKRKELKEAAEEEKKKAEEAGDFERAK